MTILTVGLVALSSVFFNIVEGLGYYVMGKCYNKDFKIHQGIGCSYYCAFFKLSTFGSGTAASGVYYLNGYKVPPVKSFGMITINYIIQKVAVVLVCIILFISHFNIMQDKYGEYFKFIIMGVGITIIFAVGLLLVILWEKFHHFLIFLADKVFKKAEIRELIQNANAQLASLRKESKNMLKDKGMILKLLVVNMVKFLGWYMIPCIVIGYTNISDIFLGISISALASALVGVIPAPGAAGSTEAMFYALFSVMVAKGQAIAVMLMYRCFSYIFPFIIGAVFILIRKTINRFYMRSSN